MIEDRQQNLCVLSISLLYPSRKVSPFDEGEHAFENGQDSFRGER